MTRVTTHHNGSQQVTNPAKAYINTVSQGHKAGRKSQMLMAGVAQKPCDPNHYGSQLITNLMKTYPIIVSQSKSQIAVFDGKSGTGAL